MSKELFKVVAKGGKKAVGLRFFIDDGCRLQSTTKATLLAHGARVVTKQNAADYIILETLDDPRMSEYADLEDGVKMIARAWVDASVEADAILAADEPIQSEDEVAADLAVPSPPKPKRVPKVAQDPAQAPVGSADEEDEDAIKVDGEAADEKKPKVSQPRRYKRKEVWAVKKKKTDFTPEEDKLLARALFKQQKKVERQGVKAAPSRHSVWKRLAEKHPNHPWESWKNRATKPKTKPIIEALLETYRARKARGQPIGQDTDDETPRPPRGPLNDGDDSDESDLETPQVEAPIPVDPRVQQQVAPPPPPRQAGARPPPVAGSSKRKASAMGAGTSDGEPDVPVLPPSVIQRAAQTALGPSLSDANIEADLLRSFGHTTFPAPLPTAVPVEPLRKRQRPAEAGAGPSSPPLHSSPPIAGPSQAGAAHSATPRASTSQRLLPEATFEMDDEQQEGEEDEPSFDQQMYDGLLYACSGDVEMANRAYHVMNATSFSQNDAQMAEVMLQLWAPEQDLQVMGYKPGDDKPAGRTDEEIRERRRFLKEQDPSRIGAHDRFPYERVGGV